MKHNKILLLNPTLYRVTGVPISLAVLSAVLKNDGFDVKVFDTAFYSSLNESHQNELRESRMMSKKVEGEDDSFQDNTTDMYQDLIDLIRDYSPTIIGVSLLEPTCQIGFSLCRKIKEVFPDSFIIAGGVFATFSPEIVIKEASIDAVCVGEGEKPFLELCQTFTDSDDIPDIRGIWQKRNGQVFQNGMAPLNNLDELPHPDYSVFDKRLLYKPMQGRLYKMINVETTRGCPYQCTYCAAPNLTVLFQENECGRYFRSMTMPMVIEQINYQVEKYNPDFIYFSSEVFLSMPNKDFDAFIEYYSDVRIPFWFQTRIETINEERLLALKEVGMHWLTIGIEHGNEEFRRSMLKRKYTNERLLKGIELLKKLDIGATMNNIIGFPHETRDLIFDTIMLNKQCWEINPKLEISVFLFTPFGGSELRELCIKEGLLNEATYLNTNTLENESVLNFPDDWKMELKGLLRTFNMYVKSPENMFDQIRIAENYDQEGNAAFDRLQHAG
jgi:anaerobic magnesium-protoporphyrin IX monomethyl ester cyclase